MSEAQRVVLADQLGALRLKVLAMKDAAADMPDFGELVKQFSDTGQHFAKAYGAIVSENWALAAPETAEAMKGLAAMLTYGYPDMGPAFTPDYAAIVRAAEIQLSAFDEAVSAQRQDIADLQNKKSP